MTTYVDPQDLVDNSRAIGALGAKDLPSTPGELKPGFQVVSKADLLRAAANAGVPQNFPPATFDKIPSPDGL